MDDFEDDFENSRPKRYDRLGRQLPSRPRSVQVAFHTTADFVERLDKAKWDLGFESRTETIISLLNQALEIIEREE